MPAKSGKQLYTGRGQAPDADRSRLGWWRDARFGLFIHWGLYAIPAGEWKGKVVEGLGEWIMYNGRIPVREYERLAESFDPVNFDAERIVALAKQAGMRYVVITAKHHEGFAMFASPCDRYNVVDATPSRRDLVGELAAACHAAGLPIGFYYSQDQDWHHPDGSWNDWDYDEDAKQFDRYFRGKVIPQVTELLTNYGPIGLIWFDTPYTMGERHSRELRELVHSLQPDCLVSGRVGNDLGDYGSLGDNQIPVGTVEGDYETPATMNDTWGFRSDDHHWKPVDRLLYLLIDLAAKGINYLLNIGPTADGTIPEQSVERLEAIGRWMDANGRAIHGTSAGPFPWEFEWGRMTASPGKLHLIFFTWPEERFVLFGVRSAVRSATTSDGRSLAVEQHHDQSLNHDSLTITGFAEPPAGLYPVVTLDIEEPLTVDERILQQPDGSITIPAFTGTIDRPADARGTETSIAHSGFTDEWRDEAVSLRLECFVTSPGRFLVYVHSAGPTQVRTGVDAPERITVEPHRVTLELDGVRAAEGDLTPDEWVESPRAQYFPEIRTRIGTVDLEEGSHTLVVRGVRIVSPRELQISSVALAPE